MSQSSQSSQSVIAALGLKDDGEQVPSPPPDRSRMTTPAAELASRIEDLLEDDDYGWAADTLSGILQTLQRTGRCSYAQERAVDNIENSRNRRR